MVVSKRAGLLVAVLLVIALIGAACGGSDDADDPAADDGDTAPASTTTSAPPESAAEVSGPIDGTPANAMPDDIRDEYGYVEEEYFLSGDAVGYQPVGQHGADGVWEVEEGDTAPYTTRVIVRRPADLDDFNGTVVVEWFNVTAGADGDPDFSLLHPVLLGEGYAYVGVSAQQVGIGDGDAEALIPIEGVGDLIAPLKQSDPERYGELSHPGDDYSYSMFADVASAARSGDLLDGTPADHVIAVGESQSAFRLTTFVDAIQPVTHAYDGFLIHSRGGGAPAVGSGKATAEETADQALNNSVAIRTDVDVPVLQFLTETDVVDLGYLRARQPDTDRIVTWEVAGAAHADISLLTYGGANASEGDAGDIAGGFAATCGSINAGPQAVAVRAALTALVSWVVDGTPPPTPPPLETADGALVRDDDGNALGGVREPAVEAPIAAHSGSNSSGELLCSLFGSTVPFSADRLAELYPTHDDYVAAVTESADAAVDGGFLLPRDRDALIAEAEEAAIPS